MKRFAFNSLVLVMLLTSALAGCAGPSTEPPTATVPPARPSMPTTGAVATEKPPAATPSRDELFTLEKQGVYRETSSAKGKLQVVSNAIRYNPRGEKYWFVNFKNLTNRVLDVELVIDWKDSSGNSVGDVERDRNQRIPPDGEFTPAALGEDYKVPRDAVGPVFWANVDDAKPIPAKVSFKYVEHPSAKGKIRVEEPTFRIEKEGTIYERWNTGGIRVYNISQSVLVQVDVNYELYSESGKIEEATNPNTVSLGYLEPGGWKLLYERSLPYEATELRLSAEVVKALPSTVTVNTEVDSPNLRVTPASPVLRKQPYQEKRDWVVDVDIALTREFFNTHAKATGAVVEIRVDFDKGQEGWLIIGSGQLKSVAGNPIVEEWLLTSGLRIGIVYPVEASHADIAVRLVSVKNRQ